MFPEVAILGCGMTNGSKDFLTKRIRRSIFIVLFKWHDCGMWYHTAADNQLMAKAPGKEGKVPTICHFPQSVVARQQQVTQPVRPPACPPGLVKTALGT